MEEVYFKVKKLTSNAVVPSKREEDAGYDLYAVFDCEYYVLRPQEIWFAPTGISVEFPKNWVLYIAERGSTGSKGISKRCGVVDSGFRGEVKVVLNNTTNKTIIFIRQGVRESEVLEKEDLQREDVVFYPQEKAIAQAMLLYTPHVQIEEVEELDTSSLRAEGMLGSSNK